LKQKELSDSTVSTIKGEGDLKPGRKVVVSGAFRTLSPSLARILRYVRILQFMRNCNQFFYMKNVRRFSNSSY